MVSNIALAEVNSFVLDLLNNYSHLLCCTRTILSTIHKSALPSRTFDSMKGCERCLMRGEECSYDVWDRCVACSQNSYAYWPPINLDVLTDKSRELRNLRSDGEHLRTTLHSTMEQSKSTRELLVQHRNQLSSTSSEADKLSLSQLQNQGRSQTKDYDDSISRCGKDDNINYDSLPTSP